MGVGENTKYLLLKKLCPYILNYKTIKTMSISNLSHGTNHYHLVRLYNAVLTSTLFLFVTAVVTAVVVTTAVV